MGQKRKDTKSWSENLKGRHKWEDNNKIDLKEQRMWVWNGFNCFRIGSSGELL